MAKILLLLLLVAAALGLPEAGRAQSYFSDVKCSDLVLVEDDDGSIRAAGFVIRNMAETPITSIIVNIYYEGETDSGEPDGDNYHEMRHYDIDPPLGHNEPVVFTFATDFARRIIEIALVEYRTPEYVSYIAKPLGLAAHPEELGLTRTPAFDLMDLFGFSLDYGEYTSDMVLRDGMLQLQFRLPRKHEREHPLVEAIREQASDFEDFSDVARFIETTLLENLEDEGTPGRTVSADG